MASSTEHSGLYEPLLPPYQELSGTRRGPAAFVVATTFLILSTITVIIKVYTMYATTRKLGWNDGMMVTALVKIAPDLGRKLNKSTGPCAWVHHLSMSWRR